MYVCAADRLPERLTFLPCAVIANTDTHDRPGTHWCSFYFDQSGKGDFFDSYGHGPDYYNKQFTRFLQRHSKNGLDVNKGRLQGDFSQTCGLYCLWFLHQRFQRISMNDTVHAFSKDQFPLNDLFVYQLFSRSFPYFIKDECFFNQTCKSFFSTYERLIKMLDRPMFMV